MVRVPSRTAAHSANHVPLFLVVSLIAGLLASGVHADTYDEWPYSKRITINTSSSGANVSATVCDFPVLVRLDQATFRFSEARDDGRDIRFSSPTGAPLPYEIQRWEPSASKAEIWVRVDTLYGGNARQYITMHWGKRGDVDDMSDPAAVFDALNGFAGVWHVEEDAEGVGTPHVYHDATLYGLHGDDSTAASGSGGVVGRGQAFDKENGDNIPMPGRAQTLDALTLSAWVNLDTIYRSSLDVPQRHNYVVGSFRWWPTVGYELNAFSDQQVAMLEVPGASKVWYYKTGVFTAARTWFHVAITWDSSGALRFYRNGEKVDEQYTGAGVIECADIPLRISAGDGVVGIDGRVDEVRRCFASRSSDWIKLCYENQRPGQKLVVVPSAREDYAQWPNSKRFYFNTTPAAGGAGVDSSLSDFVYLVRLNTNNFSFYAAAADGRDIRFSDPDGRHLHYQIESWDAIKGEAAVWVRVPCIDGNSWTDYITMHYGRYGASNREMPDSVWDTTYMSVWHLAQKPLGDSTGSMTAADRVRGAAGPGTAFDGRDDWLRTSRQCETPEALTLFAWFKTEAARDGEILRYVRKAGVWGHPRDRVLWVSRDGRVNFCVHPGRGRSLSSDAGYNDGAWHQVAAVIGGSGTGQRLYIDGVQVASNPSTTMPRRFEGTWCIGGDSLSFPRVPDHPRNAHFDGVLDEARA